MGIGSKQMHTNIQTNTKHIQTSIINDRFGGGVGGVNGVADNSDNSSGGPVMRVQTFAD